MECNLTDLLTAGQNQMEPLILLDKPLVIIGTMLNMLQNYHRCRRTVLFVRRMHACTRANLSRSRFGHYSKIGWFGIQLCGSVQSIPMGGMRFNRLFYHGTNQMVLRFSLVILNMLQHQKYQRHRRIFLFSSFGSVYTNG